VSWKLKKRIGPLAYLWAGWQAWRESRPVVKVDGVEAGEGELIMLGNGRYYGGSFPFFPRASLQDGKMDVCVFPKVTTVGMAEAVFGALTGRLDKLTAARRAQAARVTLSSGSRVLLQLDGESAGELPATLSILPQALRVIVP